MTTSVPDYFPNSDSESTVTAQQPRARQGSELQNLMDMIERRSDESGSDGGWHGPDIQQLDISDDGRFICFSKKITSNQFRTMFRGYDCDSGCEIAWACYDISRYTDGR